MTTTTPSYPYPHYGSLYAALGVLGFVLTGGPLYAPLAEEHRVRTYLSLWEMLADRYSYMLAIAALGMIGLMVLLCGIAAVRRTTPLGIPITIIILGIGGAVMLITRVGTNESPDLSVTGQMLLLSCIGAVILGVVNLIHLLWYRSQMRSR